MTRAVQDEVSLALQGGRHGTYMFPCLIENWQSSYTKWHPKAALHGGYSAWSDTIP